AKGRQCCGIFVREYPSQKFRNGSSPELGEIRQLHVCFAPQNFILNSSRKGVSRFLLDPAKAGSSKNRETFSSFANFASFCSNSELVEISEN
ncbi:MAG: hypothetical protein WCL49_13605, partial [bacterium]